MVNILLKMIIPIDTQEAIKHFTLVDPIMARLLKGALSGDPPLNTPQSKEPWEYFARIVRSIVGQQISVKAAAAVYGRVEFTVGGKVTSDSVLSVSEDVLKSCGLSGQKTKYIRHNALVWSDMPVHAFKQMSDSEITLELTKLYGVGKWTAEMFLLFSLARPDVFSFGDLALMQGVYRHYNVMPNHVRKIATIVENWSPHCSLASLCLWWHKA